MPTVNLIRLRVNPVLALVALDGMATCARTAIQLREELACAVIMEHTSSMIRRSLTLAVSVCAMEIGAEMIAPSVPLTVSLVARLTRSVPSVLTVVIMDSKEMIVRNAIPKSYIPSAMTMAISTIRMAIVTLVVARRCTEGISVRSVSSSVGEVHPTRNVMAARPAIPTPHLKRKVLKTQRSAYAKWMNLTTAMVKDQLMSPSMVGRSRVMCVNATSPGVETLAKNANTRAMTENLMIHAPDAFVRALTLTLIQTVPCVIELPIPSFVTGAET